MYFNSNYEGRSRRSNRSNPLELPARIARQNHPLELPARNVVIESRPYPLTTGPALYFYQIMQIGNPVEMLYSLAYCIGRYGTYLTVFFRHKRMKDRARSSVLYQPSYLTFQVTGQSSSAGDIFFLCSWAHAGLPQAILLTSHIFANLFSLKIGTQWFCIKSLNINFNQSQCKLTPYMFGPSLGHQTMLFTLPQFF